MRTGIYTILGIISIVLVVVLFMSVSSITGIEAPSKNKSSEEALSAFLPLEPTLWEYSDAKTFRKLMVTEELYESDKFTHLIVKGQEDDFSIKSLNERYQFEYTYKVDEEKIIRKLEGSTLIDGYKEVILLKKPLEEGNKWRDTWESLSGDTYSITSRIKSIDEEGKLIVVESKEDADNFIVNRTFEYGKGITEVSIVEKYDSVDFETGFQLLNFKPFEYKGFDSYMAFLGNEKIGTLIDKISESETVGSNEDSKETQTEDNVAEEVEEKVIEDQEIDEDTRAAITGSIQLFNDKWIAFINEGDLSIMDTIIPGSSAEKIIQAYMNKEMQQKFLAMDFQRVVVKGDVANVYVYEEIERTMDGVTEVLIYNWIYEVDYVDGKWLVEGYIENKSF